MKKRTKKNGLVERACRKLKIQARELFLAAREWVNAAFGRRIKRGEAIAAFNAYDKKGYLISWFRAFLNRNVFAPA